MFHFQKIDSYIKSSIIWQLNFLSKKMIHVKEKVLLVKLFKIFEGSVQKESTDALTTTK